MKFSKDYILLLRSYDVSSNSKIYHAFSKSQGKISIYIPGIKMLKSKKARICDYGNMLIAHLRQKNDLWYIDDAELFLSAPRNDSFAMMCHISDYLELLSLFSYADIFEHAEHIFRHTEMLYRLLDIQDVDEKYTRILLAATFQLLFFTGFIQKIDICSICHISLKNELHGYFRVDNATYMCKKCSCNSDMQFDIQTLKILYIWQKHELQDIIHIHFSTPLYNQITDILERTVFALFKQTFRKTYKEAL
jgi:DNA repair protein RecO